jgi:hypothetical protein
VIELIDLSKKKKVILKFLLKSNELYKKVSGIFERKQRPKQMTEMKPSGNALQIPKEFMPHSSFCEPDNKKLMKRLSS